MKPNNSEYLPDPDPDSRRRKLPPHSLEAEQGAIACALLDPLCMTQMARLPRNTFYDLRHATLFAELLKMHHKAQLIDLVTVHVKMKDARLLKEIGGLQYLQTLPDRAPSSANLPYYLSILKEKHAMRELLAICRRAESTIAKDEGAFHDMMNGIQADLDTVTRLGLSEKENRKLLNVHNSKAILAHELDPKTRLVGDNEICTGYDGVALISGPGGSGKSLAAITLALAGAIGYGTWMGRKVHRQFRTLIIQAENGMVRLKAEFLRLKAQHPEVDLDNWIFISEPPEGGLPFHRGQFRAEVRAEIDHIKPDLVIVDPWSQVATDDSSKDVVEKLAEIRGCFPAGAACPGLMILAHTKKPRSEDVRKGRSLINSISGSIALANTARCAYMLLPWSDDMVDTRIYWACCKLNNGEPYAATVWHRKFGTFFEHDPKTNPLDWGRSEGEDDRRALTSGQLQDAFGKDKELAVRDLVKRLCKLAACGESTAYKAVNEDGYLRPLMLRTGNGKLKLKDPTT